MVPLSTLKAYTKQFSNNWVPDRTNGHRDKWIPDKWAPEQMGPGQMGQGNNCPGHICPRITLSWVLSHDAKKKETETELGKVLASHVLGCTNV